MKTTKKKVLGLLLSAIAATMLLFAVGCTSSGGAKEVAVTEGTIVAEGSSITASLEGNATTGFMWIADIEGDTVVQVTDNYVPIEAEKGAPEIVGAGGTHELGFTASGTGDSVITFKYTRSFEEKAGADDIIYKVKASVKDGVVDKLELQK